MTHSNEDPRRPNLKRSLSAAFRQIERGEQRHRSFWKSLAILGSVGWPIVALTAGGGWLGHWLDQRFHTTPCWALILLTIGAIMGTYTAWRSVRPES